MSGLLAERSRFCAKTAGDGFWLLLITGNDGRVAPAPTVKWPFTPDGPSRDAARPGTGAVKRFGSSLVGPPPPPHALSGVACRGKGNMPDDELARVDAGESAVGEKYEAPMRSPGDGAAAAGSCVCSVNGGGSGGT